MAASKQPEAARLAARLPRAPRPRQLVSVGLPVLAWTGDLRERAAPETAAMAEIVDRHAHDLAWGQTYGKGDLSEAFLARYGWCELLGLRGHFGSEEAALGVLLLGPETHYPLHSHAAEEVYVVLSGTAAWTRGEEAEALRPPGSAVHHPSWMPHGMRTAEEPLLALYLWAGGDLAQKSRIS